MDLMAKQYGKNRYSIINGLGLKRLFAFKTGDMHELKWPPNTPEFEKPGLSIMYFQAYVWKQLQEITIILIEKLTKDLKKIKKDPNAQLDLVDYDSKKPNSPFADFTNIKKLNQSLYQKLFGINEQELGKYNNQTINETIKEHNTDIKTPKNSKKEKESYKNKKQMVQLLSEHIKQLEKEGKICRISKQNIKHDFKKLIEQIKYYLKLVKSGKIQRIRIRYKNGNIDGCDNYDYNWEKYKSKLSETIQTAIQKAGGSLAVPD